MVKALWLLVLLVPAIAACSIQPITAPADDIQARTPALYYLVPEDEVGVEDAFTSTALNQANVLRVIPVGSQAAVQKANEDGTLNALLIHHTALDRIDRDTLNTLAWEGITIAGLGIPGDVLAKRIGMPFLFDLPADSGYGDSTRYYYVYTFAVDGVRRTTDSVVDGNGVRRMLHVIGEHLE